MEKKRIIIMIMFIVAFIMAIISSLIYNNGKYSVQFETGTNEIILTKYVNKNEKIEEPVAPIKEGYVFKEWQLNGKTYNFDEEIKDDTILTAEWIKEEYIKIIFDTDSTDIVENKKILKGNSINELPKVTKEGYEFIGWYLGDKLYNSEKIYDDATLKAYYKKIEPSYKIGDKIKIIGSYSSSSTATVDEAYNKKAIGWERKIINKIEGSEFPYVIGNDDGITGFFKSSSIEKID